jgi:hypothetical protein
MKIIVSTLMEILNMKNVRCKNEKSEFTWKFKEM